jgi:Flp pilus assembly protein TadD
MNALKLWPENPIRHLNLAVCLYALGEKDQAESIFRQLEHEVRYDDDADALALCIRYERDLRIMNDIPSLNRILHKLGV